MMPSDKTRDQAEHQQLDVVFVVWLFKLREKPFCTTLRVKKRVDREEISISGLLTFPFFLALKSFDCTVELSFFRIWHKTTFMVSEHLMRVVIWRVRLWFRFVFVVQNQKELACCSDYFRILMFASFPDSIDCFVIIPDFALVQFNHNVERSSRRIFRWILKHLLDESLKLLVDSVILSWLVQLLHVCNHDTVQVFSQSFVFAFEKF